MSGDSIISLDDLSGGGSLALGGPAAVVTFSGKVQSNRKIFVLTFKKPFGIVYIHLY